MVSNNKLQEHVTFCPNTNPKIFQSGRQAELDTVQYLVDHLNVHKVGQYQLLVNYNLPLYGRGRSGTLEIDIVVINKFGVFLLEVKDWRGVVQAYDDYWVQSPNHRRKNALNSIEGKAKVFHSTLFGYKGRLKRLGQVSVAGMVILVRGVQNFKNYSHNPKVNEIVTGLDHELIQALSSTNILYRGKYTQMLSNDDIQRVKNALYSSHQGSETQIIGNYLVLGELSPGDLFEAYEAVNTYIESQRVRIKCYRLPNISATVPTRTLRHFKQNAEALAKLGNHPNIVQTHSFFQDDKRSDISYEVTELPSGIRLDEMMAQCTKPLSLAKQISYLAPICQALAHAHRHEVYHRNLCPQTIYVAEDTVQVADFDFAKVMDKETISVAGETLVDSVFTAPEVNLNSSAASAASDIYSLGALWYFLARLPEHPQSVEIDEVDELNLAESARTLMKQMLTEVVKRRPQSVEEVLEKLRGLK